MNNWNRKELKAKAKVSFKANYWKCVLAALLLVVFAGGASGGSFSGAASGAVNGFNAGANKAMTTPYQITEEDIQAFDDQDAADDFFNNLDEELQSDVDSIENDIQADSDDPLGALSIVALIMILFAILLVLLIIGIAVTVFFGNPFSVGLRKFFVDNANEKAKLGTIMQNFDNSYRNTVKVMFFMQLKLLGWTLLLIIPGIIKAYEYRMIPYLLADNPAMEPAEAHANSKAMMMGNKWKAFVLDLSFIGWFILSGLTLGILSLFYVNPYYYQTDANLYHALKEKQITGETPAAPELTVEPVEVDFVN